MPATLREIRANREQYYNERETSERLHFSPGSLQRLAAHDLLHPINFHRPHGNYYLRHEVDMFHKQLLKGEWLRIKPAADLAEVPMYVLQQACRNNLVQYIELGSALRLFARQEVLRFKELMSNKYVGLNEAAQILGVNKVTAWRWANFGRLSTARVGTKWRRYRRSEVERLKVLRGKEWLTLGETAELMGCAPSEVRWMVKKGFIPTQEVNGVTCCHGPTADSLTLRTLRALSESSFPTASQLPSLAKEIILRLGEVGGAVYSREGRAAKLLADSLHAEVNRVKNCLYQLSKKSLVGYEFTPGRGIVEVWLRPSGEKELALIEPSE
jgi:DNA-binding transcriptional MerR regulator